MQVDTVHSDDGTALTYAHVGAGESKPWIAFILPFGMRIELARAFFDFYQPRYNVLTWESRLILDPTPREVEVSDLAVARHVQDLASVLAACNVERAILMGYCSGAGIALAASNQMPERFTRMLLVHGEYALLEDDACTTQFAAEIDSLLSMAGKSEKYARAVFEKISGERLAGNQRVPDGMDTPYTNFASLRRHALNYLAYKSTDFKALAQTASHRTLLLTGNRDIQANVQSTRCIHGLMRHAELHIDPSGDHYGMVREESPTMITIWNYLHGQQH